MPANLLDADARLVSADSSVGTSARSSFEGHGLKSPTYARKCLSRASADFAATSHFSTTVSSRGAITAKRRIPNAFFPWNSPYTGCAFFKTNRALAAFAYPR